MQRTGQQQQQQQQQRALREAKQVGLLGHKI
jgi:hypothetical protein